MSTLPYDVKKAIELLKQDTAQRMSVGALAKACGVSRRTLQKHFRDHLGKTPSQVRYEERLNGARVRLLSAGPNDRIADVAEQHGFNHLGRFAASYKKHFGETPSATVKRRRQAKALCLSTLTFHSSIVERPVVAVRPFSVLGTHEQGAAAIADEVSVRLVRKSWLVVGPRDRARYQLCGKVRNAGSGRLAVMVTLADMATGVHLWADRWEGAGDEIHHYEEQVAERVARAVEQTVLTREVARARSLKQDSPDAWVLTLRALPRALQIEPTGQAQALELLECARELAPHDSLPVALAAWCHANRGAHFFTSQPEVERQAARALARQAVELDTGEAVVHALLGAAHTLTHDLELATLHCDRALALDGSCVWAWNRSGLLNTYLGRSVDAIECAQIARCLGPDDPLKFGSSIAIGSGHFLNGRFEEAARWWTQCLGEHPAAIWINRFRAAAFALAGKKEAARGSFSELMKSYPELRIREVRSALPHPQSYRDQVSDALSSLGMRP